MNGTKDIFTKRSPRELYGITKERLSDTNACLTSLLFRQGANLYVFSYEKEGMRRHSLIDTGDSRYRNQIQPILVENDINPTNIERIIITHRHPDHCGLVNLLARASKAKILVHPNFKRFVEGEISKEERRWMSGFDPSELKEHDIEYLPSPDKSEVRNISGVDFPILVESIEIGEAGKLMILACPGSTQTHSPDQIIILYSPKSCPDTYEQTREDLRPTDDILFSGDLWLMRGPLFNWSFRNISRYFRYKLYRVKSLMSGKTVLRRDAREQDSEAKEGLKRGFVLIRVKPGHGEEFIGSRIIPHSLLADRDLLAELGYAQDGDKTILKEKDLASKIAALKERAYSSFVKELLFWRELGYTLDEISELLVQIYKEQSGGDRLVKQDRKERRKSLKATLARLKEDEAESEELHELAESTLLKLKRVLQH